MTTLTFLFTDIEGSTDLWERAPDAMRHALARHDELVRKTIAERDGRVFATGGDGVAAVFERADDAIRAAVDVQSCLAAEPWSTPVPIRVRVGIHTGEAEQRDGDFFGPTLNRCARLMSVAHGGQVVCSAATAALSDGSPRVPLVDLGQHRLRDLSAPVAVFQVGDGSFPPLRSLDSVPSNLPTMVTDLVGRTDDVRALVAEVRSSRLVTLTGVGGVGKTRLALAVGGAVAPDFVDGCWLAELAPVADGAEVVRVVTSALGAINVAAGDVGALVRYLEHRRLVLILDNCEHVLDATAALVDDVLAAAPDVHVVTTSREPLGVDGEVVRRVRSLDADPSIALFVQRASAADGDFELTAENAGDVADICQHLDGIPLAIELAAARVRAMTPADIARRLDDRFRMLTGGRRAQERHRTLQAAVGWSYDLLSEDDRRIFASLSVFPATFDLAAGVAVAGTDDVEAIVRLVDRSLVVHDPVTGRYRLLETLRQYGADRLAEIGESEAARERYCDHYRRLASAHGPGVSDRRHDGAVTALLAELDNLRATADALARAGQWDALRRLTIDAAMFLSQFAPSDEVDWMEAVLAGDAGQDADADVVALGVAALGAVNAQRFDVAGRFAARSIELASGDGVGESPWSRFALTMLSTFGLAPDDAGLEHVVRAEEAAIARGDAMALVGVRSQRTVLLGRLGRYEEADAAAADALAVARELGNRTALSVALVCTLSMLLVDRKPPDVDRARALLDAHGDDALGSYGGLNDAWLLIWRAIARCDLDPAGAMHDTIQAARYIDRAESPYALLAALGVLAIACARAGLVREAVALDGYLARDTAMLAVNSMLGWLAAEREAAIAAVAPAVDGPVAVPATRQELFAVLGRIEQAIAT